MAIITGVKIQGARFTGAATLESIGDMLYHLDFRRSVEVNESNEIMKWTDTARGLAFEAPATGRAKLYSDGMGTRIDPLLSQSNYVRTGYTEHPGLRNMHSDKAYMAFAIAKRTSGGNTTIPLTIVENRALPLREGQYLDMREILSFRSRTLPVSGGGSIIENTTTTGSMPNNEFRLLMRVYYGRLAGTNNIRMYIGNSLSQFSTTINPSSTNNNYRISVGRTTGGTGDFRIKKVGAYNLEDKTPTQINNLVNTFITMLKQDSEYSGLTTPIL